MNIHECIKKISSNFENLSKTHNSIQDAWWLLEKLTEKNKTQLIAQKNIHLTESQQQLLSKWIYQRVHENKPLQYILGSVPFCDLEILVEPPILIPRPETEEWVTSLIETLIPLKHQKLKILDLCSGSGCITLALAKVLTNSKVIGLDIDEKAIKLSKKNMLHNQIPNVEFIQSDLYEAVESSHFDLIVSNPPYISEKTWQTLEPEVKHWESKIALAAGDGLDLYKKIISRARSFLNSNNIIPQIALEIGYNQGNEVKQLLLLAGFKNIELVQDISGNDRFIKAH